MRSNGSRRGLGSAPARVASGTLIASSLKPWLAIPPAMSAANARSTLGSLPSRCLVAISQAEAALTRISFSSSEIA